GQAPEAHGLREASARRRVEAAQAREEKSEAPPASPREQADRHHGRAPSAAARALSLIGEDGTHATGQGWTEDTAPAQEDPQAGEGVCRRDRKSKRLDSSHEWIS